MNVIEQRFEKLSTEYAPGQEMRQQEGSDVLKFRGEVLPGPQVDFSHGDVNVDAFEPAPGSLKKFIEGVESGGLQAYTEYRGREDIRQYLSGKLTQFTGCPISAADGLIITPGTQSALFLAIASTVSSGDKVAVVAPDYFANRKIVSFVGGEIIPIELDYLGKTNAAGLDLERLEGAFRSGARIFLFSNPNNPTGTSYSAEEIKTIADLANKFGVFVIVDQLYSRLLYPGHAFTHLCASGIEPQLVMTVMGPSKTESLSGYRLGVAFGEKKVIDRMERLQSIVSLRAPGYSQAVLYTWLSEPADWLDERIARHQVIRDDLLSILRSVDGLSVRTTEAGSYIFPRLPNLITPLHDFIRVLRYQASVIVTAGTEFCPKTIDSIRLNFSQNHDAAIKAVDRIAILVDRYRS